MREDGNHRHQNRHGTGERHTLNFGLGGVPTTGSGDRLSRQRVRYSGSLEFWSRVERLNWCILCFEAPHGPARAVFSVLALLKVSASTSQTPVSSGASP